MAIRYSGKSRSAPKARHSVATRRPRKIPLGKLPPGFTLTAEQAANPINQAFWRGVQLGRRLCEMERKKSARGRPVGIPELADSYERVVDLVSDLPPLAPESAIRDRLRDAFPGLDSLKDLPELRNVKDFAATLLALLYPGRSKSEDARVDAILRAVPRQRKRNLQKITKEYNKLGIARREKGPVTAEEYMRVAGALIESAARLCPEIPILQELARYLRKHFPLSR